MIKATIGEIINGFDFRPDQTQAAVNIYQRFEKLYHDKSHQSRQSFDKILTRFGFWRDLS
ncbi:MAG: hypothetical protein ACREPR_08395 [Brasilonema sp.]